MRFITGFITYVLIVHVTYGQQSAHNQVCLIVPPDVEECYRSFQGKPITGRAAQIECLRKLLWDAVPSNDITSRELDFFSQFQGDTRLASAEDAPGTGGAAVRNTRRPSGRIIYLPASGYRVRREYRTLSRRERERFHGAMNTLHQNGQLHAFARLHAVAVSLHHGGASFLPWHRAFLAMFEEALRRVNRRVFLPYWDSTIDDAMDNPVNSVLWSSEYFGNGAGDVTSGFAAGWVTDQGNLQRDYGKDSRLFSKEQIKDMLTRCNLKDISRWTAAPMYDFEYFHGGPHRWVGGDMGAGRTAGYDPVFYMHHAYVDYIWEVFRRRQARECGVDPSTDYPDVAVGDSHHPDANMTGFSWLKNNAGIASYWTSYWYSYEPTPACPDCCPECKNQNNERTMYCSRQKRVCVGASRRTFTPVRGAGTSPAFGQFLDQGELSNMQNPSPSRNRGRMFDAPPSDGRTIETILADAQRAGTDAGAQI